MAWPEPLAAGFAAAAAAAGADPFWTIAERAIQLTDLPYPASFAAAVALPFSFCWQDGLVPPRVIGK